MNSETGSVVPAPHGPGRSILAPATPEFANLVERLVASAEQCRGEPQAMLATLSEDAVSPEDFPLPGEHTLALWELLAEVAATDLVAVRTLEPHLDALAITAQSPEPVPAKGTWGVYAAEGGDSPLTAHNHLGAAADVHLNGVKPWCSLAGSLDAALVTAHTDAGRQLFAIDLHHPGVQVERVRWVSRGLAHVPSGPVRFDNVPALAVGAVGWYFDRPGFAWGGAGVAACWFGGAVGVYRDLVSAAAQRPPDQIGFALLGRAARLVRTGKTALTDAAERVDNAAFDWPDSLALRSTIADICADVLEISSLARGPSALAFDDVHARRVADLAMYLQQHHGGRDDAALGEFIVSDDPWHALTGPSTPDAKS